MKKASKKSAAEPVVTAYKGFDKDLKCRGFQYAIGETAQTDGDVVRCGAGGLHSCEYPLDVFGYYAPATSRFAVVKASGKIARETDGDSKIASASLLVEAEIALPTMVSKAIEWVMSKLDTSLEQTLVTGYRSAASNTGDYSAASNTGYRSAAGGAIVVCFRDDEGALIHIRASKVGENGVQPDTFYVLDADGEFVAVEGDQ